MKKRDAIKINFVGRLESGEVFDLTYADIAKKEGIHNERVKYGPIPIIVGAGFVIKGLENAILDMNVGDKKTIDVEPKDAFGERDPRLVKVVPQKMFKDQKVEPRPGMVVDFSGTKGRIQSAAGGRITVDFNNPLAGKTLKYEIEVVQRIDDTVEKIKGVFEFFGFYDMDVSISGKEATIKIAIPPELKHKLGNVIFENIDNIEKINFVETFEKKEDNKNKTGTTSSMKDSTA